MLAKNEWGGGQGGGGRDRREGYREIGRESVIII